ncbi:LacI family DNA-binding transcriptional regulator [Phycisphaerales bacterium AB-hyl4]|uniref:LacI family DNA-binding transcriptional regulator n=1 Tax=Natronomicrosphaera hydrolytica TaxID=3242702 RepID=A0ABV4U9J6_9BACT
MATLESIAKDLNLSTATVSRALRGARGVNKATRTRVEVAAERLGYVKLRRQEMSKDIAILVPSKSHSDMHELARRHMIAISDEIAKRGWRLQPVFMSGDHQDFEAVLDGRGEQFGNSGRPADGCLVIGQLPSAEDDPHAVQKRLAERFDGNVVMICRHDVLHGISGVSQMNYVGGTQAVRLLLDAGHRRIGWVGSLGSRDSAEERLGGVLTQVIRTPGASLDCQIWLDDTKLLPTTYMVELFAEALPRNRADWPTAWVCSTDWLAAKFIIWARGQGANVPADMSVVAFDNTRVSEELAETIITSVVFPYEQIARKAVELLGSLMDSPTADSIVWTLPPRVRVGETVGQRK